MFELTPFYRSVRRNGAYPFRALDEFERNFFSDGRTSPSCFCTDVVDNGDSFSLITDLPGFKKEDISVEISGDTLTLNAERHSEYENREKKDGFVRMERSFGSYRRAFDISGIEADNITAAYTDGVLTITLPKTEKKTPESRKLEIL